LGEASTPVTQHSEPGFMVISSSEQGCKIDLNLNKLCFRWCSDR